MEDINMDILDPNPDGKQEGGKSILREAMEDKLNKTEIKLTGNMCIDDERNIVWSKAAGPKNEDVYVLGLMTSPEAEELKDKVSKWEQFVVISAQGQKLGTAREYFLTK